MSTIAIGIIEESQFTATSQFQTFVSAAAGEEAALSPRVWSRLGSLAEVSDSRGRAILNLGRCLSGSVRLTLLQQLREPACRPRGEERMRSFLRTVLVCLATVIGIWARGLGGTM